jgi:quinol-cytochrome oxidoreductase complex cytochrome b subunit
VLLPAPFGPNSPKISPTEIERKKNHHTQIKVKMEITLLKKLTKNKYQPFFTQKDVYLVATFFIFLE